MPTALELTPAELKNYQESLRHRAVTPSLTTAERAQREALLKRVAEAAALLKSKFGARRVILFGSLAHQAWFVSNSDVDLAVEGLSGDYWQAWRSVEEIIDDRQVDLIEIETASNALRQAIQHHGVRL
jgi:predicted nucleotidyltransferase